MQQQTFISSPRTAHALTSTYCCSGRSSCFLPACCWESSSSFPSWPTSTPMLTLSSWKKCTWSQGKGKMIMTTWRERIATYSWPKWRSARNCNPASCSGVSCAFIWLDLALQVHALDELWKLPGLTFVFQDTCWLTSFFSFFSSSYFKNDLNIKKSNFWMSHKEV